MTACGKMENSRRANATILTAKFMMESGRTENLTEGESKLGQMVASTMAIGIRASLPAMAERFTLMDEQKKGIGKMESLLKVQVSTIFT